MSAGCFELDWVIYLKLMIFMITLIFLSFVTLTDIFIKLVLGNSVFYIHYFINLIFDIKLSHYIN